MQFHSQKYDNPKIKTHYLQVKKIKHAQMIFNYVKIERGRALCKIYILLCSSTRVRTIIANAAVRENKVYLMQ